MPMADRLSAAAPSLADFERLMARAFARLPPEVRRACADLLLRVADFAPDEILDEMEIEDPYELTGLYEGVALTDRSVLMQPDRPDAVFAANDVIAVGCMVALREAGLRVPDHIAVAGFDDIPLASLVSPALTTVRVQIAELGRAALEQLLLSIENPARTRPVSRALLPEVVVRESCGSEKPPKRRSRRQAARSP